MQNNVYLSGTCDCDLRLYLYLKYTDFNIGTERAKERHYHMAFVP